MKTIAIYVRVSTIEQKEDGYSLGEQQDRLSLFAQAHGWAVVGVYSDPGFSGAKLDRPAIQEIIRGAEQHCFDAVLVYKLDRLSRSQKDTLYLIEDVFNKNGVGLISMCENFDTQTPFGKAMIGILSVFAQLERDQINERMTMGRIGRAKAGYYAGNSRPPIGYTYKKGSTGDRETLQIDPYEAMQVREIYDLFLNGRSGKEYTFKAILSYLHDSGYKTKYGSWTAAGTVSRILHDRTYIGEVSFSGKWYPGRHDPIIDKNTFDRVQEKYKHYMAGATGSFSENFKGASLLTGLLRCGLCGSRYFTKTWKRNNRKGTQDDVEVKYTRKYACYAASGQSRRMAKGKKCSNIKVPVETLDSIVIREISKLHANPELLERECETEPGSGKAEALQRRIEEIETQESRLIELYQIGSIDLSVVRKKADELKEEKERLTSSIEIEKAAHGAKIAVSEATKRLATFADAFELGNMQQKRALIRSLIDEIVIFPDHIEIHWTFSAK